MGKEVKRNMQLKETEKLQRIITTTSLPANSSSSKTTGGTVRGQVPPKDLFSGN